MVPRPRFRENMTPLPPAACCPPGHAAAKQGTGVGGCGAAHLGEEGRPEGESSPAARRWCLRPRMCASSSRWLVQYTWQVSQRKGVGSGEYTCRSAKLGLPYSPARGQGAVKLGRRVGSAEDAPAKQGESSAFAWSPVLKP